MSGMGAYTVGPKYIYNIIIRSTFNGMKSTTKVYNWNGELTN